VARFTTSLLTLVTGFMLVLVALLSFRGLGWLTLGFGALATTTSLAVFPVYARSAGQRVGDVVIMVIGGWTIVASRAFSGSSLRWLGFAGGAAIAAVSLLALTGAALLTTRGLARLESRTPTDGAEARDLAAGGNGSVPAEHAFG
jgi:uncharacterized membrane protein